MQPYHIVRTARASKGNPARWQIVGGRYGERSGFEPYVVLPWKWDTTPNYSRTIARFLNAPGTPFPGGVSYLEFNRAQVVRFEPGRGVQVFDSSAPAHDVCDRCNALLSAHQKTTGNGDCFGCRAADRKAARCLRRLRRAVAR